MSQTNFYTNGRIYYVEPNFMDENIKTVSSNTTLAHKYEDYNIIVDLIVEYQDRYLCGQENNYVDVSGRKLYMHFIGGKNGYLTTDYTDLSFENVKDGGNPQCIGIESIIINYESWYTPSITINFVDVRGAALMIPQEHDYIEYCKKEAGDKKDYTAKGSFFKSLFAFPPPVFYLRVKGFYGDSTTYKLALAKIELEFDAQTGNFKIVGQFIGYMFGIFADLPMVYCAVAPYTDTGREHWDSAKYNYYGYQTDELDGIAVNPICEFIQNANNVYAEINAELERDDSRHQQIRDIELKSTLDELNNNPFSFIDGGIKCSNQIKNDGVFMSHRVEGSEADDLCEYLFISKGENDDLKDTLQECYEHIYTHCCNSDGKLNLPETGSTEFENDITYRNCHRKLELFWEDMNALKKNGYIKPFNNGSCVCATGVIKVNCETSPAGGNIYFEQESTIIEDAVKTNNEIISHISGVKGFINKDVFNFQEDVIEGFITSAYTETKVNQYTWYAYKVHNVGFAIEEQTRYINEKVKQLNNAILENQNITTDETLGFVPTIKNIYRMIFCHMETFMSMFDKCLKDIYEENKKGDSSNRKIDDYIKYDYEADVEPKSKNGARKEKYFPPFPRFVMETDRNKGISRETVWPEEFDNRTSDFPEVKLVNEILAGASQFAEKSLENSLILNSYHVDSNCGDFIRTILPDLMNYSLNGDEVNYVLKNPYSNLAKQIIALNDNDEIIKLLLDWFMFRMTYFYMSYSTAADDNSDYGKTFAYLEAFNAYAALNEGVLYDRIHDALSGVTSSDGLTHISGYTTNLYSKTNRSAITSDNKFFDGDNSNIYNFLKLENNSTLLPIKNYSVQKVNSVIGAKEFSEEDFIVTNQNNSADFNDYMIFPFTDRTGSKTLNEQVDEYSNGSLFNFNLSGEQYTTILNLCTSKEKNPKLGELLSDDFNVKIKDIDVKNFSFYDLVGIDHDTSIFYTSIFYRQFSEETTRLCYQAYLFINSLKLYANPGTFLSECLGYGTKGTCYRPYADILLEGAFWWRYNNNNLKTSNDTDAFDFSKGWEKEYLPKVSARKVANGEVADYNPKYGFCVYPDGQDATESFIHLRGSAETYSKVRKEVCLREFTKFASKVMPDILNVFGVKVYADKKSDNTRSIMEDDFFTIDSRRLFEGTYTLHNRHQKCMRFEKLDCDVYQILDMRIAFGANNVDITKIVRTLCSTYIAINPRYAMLTGKRLNTGFNFKNEIVSEGVREFLTNLSTYFGNTTEETEEQQKARQALDNINNTIESKDLKLATYLTLKNLYDKWICGTSFDKDFKMGVDTSVFSKFTYIDSFHKDIGNKLRVNVSKLTETLIHTCNTSSNDIGGMSVFETLSEIANTNDCLLFSVPFMFGQDDTIKSLQTLFDVKTYRDAKMLDDKNRFVLVYTYKPSTAIDDTTNDGFDIANTYGPSNIILPPQLASSSIDECFGRDADGHDIVPAIGVTYGMQNQNYFKDIKLTSTNPTESEYSISSTLNIANKASDGPQNAELFGQDLYRVFSNYAYKCSVSMMGNVLISPLMYFQLNNIPMWKGAYQITKVSHEITPGNMTTTFEGYRVCKYALRLSDGGSASLTMGSDVSDTDKVEPVGKTRIVERVKVDSKDRVVQGTLVNRIKSTKNGSQTISVYYVPGIKLSYPGNVNGDRGNNGYDSVNKKDYSSNYTSNYTTTEYVKESSYFNSWISAIQTVSKVYLRNPNGFGGNYYRSCVLDKETSGLVAKSVRGDCTGFASACLMQARLVPDNFSSDSRWFRETSNTCANFNIDKLFTTTKVGTYFEKVVLKTPKTLDELYNENIIKPGDIVSRKNVEDEHGHTTIIAGKDGNDILRYDWGGPRTAQPVRYKDNEKYKFILALKGYGTKRAKESSGDDTEQKTE